MTATLHRPLLIVIAGPNGSGKTTITHKLLHHDWLEDALYINPDNIAQEKFGDWNSPDAILKAVKYCKSLREDCLAHRRSLIFETVRSGSDKVDFIKRAMETGYFVRLFFISTNNPTINAARIAKRVMEWSREG
ncbi:MAG: zeta toxin family protein [Bacteroidales bacterium]|nr:zeta toxin family protein [Bacteroidales bacterium]